MKRFLFIRAMVMLVMVGASWGVIANTAYTASLPIKNEPLKEEYSRERLKAEIRVKTTETNAVEVMKKIKPGQRLPNMILKGLNGKTYDVGATRNKALVISFWASWCDPCRLEAPMLNELYSKYKDDVDVYGINVTRYDRLEDVQRFSRSLDLQFPILLDEQGTLFERFGGVAFPTHVMVDHHGQVREIIIGMLSEQELERKIESLQKKKVSLEAE
ncbi:TlpA disulfide reductase family protein [Paenibacillus polymyxa]|uniref:TlpA family protein disulfide reductase n=1 Tax=Paenibacillus polymyxa TaxID=1406 RepID=UPI002AB52C7E|nr:TlpA disulfide reductase family protein [Paenibacillus polymyxa]MDY8024692.1 TlpA disulfide reductase family protein [Paenibacillus polymyxa]